MGKRKLLQGFLLLYFILGSWKGYLALYEKDAQEPRQIYPKLVETLPESDQLALEEGIPVRNQRRLDQLLEDYLS